MYLLFVCFLALIYNDDEIFIALLLELSNFHLSLFEFYGHRLDLFFAIVDLPKAISEFVGLRSDFFAFFSQHTVSNQKQMVIAKNKILEVKNEHANIRVMKGISRNFLDIIEPHILRMIDIAK